MEEPPRVFLHGDCQDDHFLWDTESGAITAIVDFGDAGTGDALWDIATLTQFRLDKLPWVLDGYRPKAGLRMRAEVLLPAHWVLRHLTAASWCVENDISSVMQVDCLAGIAADIEGRR